MIEKYLEFTEGKLHLVFGITHLNQIRLLHCSALPYNREDECNFGDRNEELYFKDGYQFAQVNLAGYDRPYEKQGNMYVATTPGASMTFVGWREEKPEESAAKGEKVSAAKGDPAGVAKENPAGTAKENPAGAAKENPAGIAKEDPAGNVKGTAPGRVIIITQEDEATKVRVETRIQFFAGLSVARFTNTITNIGDETQTLEYLGSFSYLGLEKEGLQNADRKMRLYVPHNGWQKEITWSSHSFEELGIAQTQPHIMNRTSKTIEFTNTGHWSAKTYLPMAYLENREADTGLFFQIEHNGSWHWEIGMQDNHFYLNVSGPTELQSHFSKDLKPGEAFTSVPVSVGVSRADISLAMDELTRYRRAIRRPNADNEKLPVIFNDYMNCLFGDPTTEKELPLIDAAAEAGCEYYVIDAGWYADGAWWDGVGEWNESRKRFPGGIREVTDYIRSKGMVAGVWLELEVMGINCNLAKKAPDDWFFVRHGKRVYDRSRYQLDFRNPEVQAHVNAVIDKVVGEYGVGYIKMDYNIEPGIGTEINADSFGDGMLQHERAYLAWLDGIFQKYPDLVIENCSSGGLRMDYAMLSRYSIQSTSDQEDYIQYSTIAANVPTGVTSEQAAVWSYPLKEETARRFRKEKELPAGTGTSDMGQQRQEKELPAGTGTSDMDQQAQPSAGVVEEQPLDLREETIFNMVNALLCRIHQSGHLREIAPERLALVKEGIAFYKTIRGDIKESVPFWPLGLAKTTDPWVCLAIHTDEKAYLAVWRRGTPDTGAGSDFCEIPLEKLFAGSEKNESREGLGKDEKTEPLEDCRKNMNIEPGNACAKGDWKVRLAYPAQTLSEHCRFRFAQSSRKLTVQFTEPVMARVFTIWKDR